MIQRKQSLYLLLAALLAMATFAFPIATYEQAGEVLFFRTTGLVHADGEPLPEAAPRVPFAWVLSAAAGVLLLSIILFHNRPRQMRFVRGAYLMLLGVVVFQFITHNSILSWRSTMSGEVHYSLGVAFYLPMVAVLFAFLAERAIRADEALVRSADRLR
jgi:hypothetical protein